MENIAFGFLLINLLYVAVIWLVIMFFFKRTRQRLRKSNSRGLKSKLIRYKIVYLITFITVAIIFFFLVDSYFIFENILVPLFLIVCMVIILKLQSAKT